MPKIRILAFEDEELHADILRVTLDKLNYELIAILSNVKEGMNIVRASRPDIILMDIDLEGSGNGIELVSKINETENIPVIYITSHKDEAVFSKAKATLPESYITKPYDPFQLQSAIELCILKNYIGNAREDYNKEKINYDEAVFVKEGQSLIKISVKDIQLIEAYDKYCYVYAKEKKYLLAMTLKAVTKNLPTDTFVQVHRSYVVNFNTIEKALPSQNTLEVGGQIIPVSKTYRNLVFSRFKVL